MFAGRSGLKNISQHRAEGKVRIRVVGEVYLGVALVPCKTRTVFARWEGPLKALVWGSIM